VNWGRSLPLRAVVRDSSGAALTGVRIIWSSDAPATVVVAADGTVTGLQPGRATVTAMTGALTATAAVRVHVPVTRLTAPSRFHGLVAGGTLSLPVTPRDSLGRALAGRPIAWTSSDAAIASVDTAGIVTGNAPGTVTVTAVSEGATLDLTVTVARPRFVALDAGLAGHTCALDDAGGAWCWGANAVGQLGTGSRAGAATAVHVLGGHRFGAVGAGGLFTCGIATDGRAYCWGSGARGRLGTGELVDSAVPVAVAGIAAYDALGVGWQHTCAVATSGATRCWGGAALGADSLKIAVAPMDIGDALGLRDPTAGDAFACARGEDGATLCWGENTDGRLGDGTTDHHAVPAPVAAGVAFTGLTSGMGHTCGLAPDGAAWCWGANGYGQLGSGDTVARSAPAPVATALRFATIAAGAGFTCAVALDGAAYCWGRGRAGQLGAVATDACGSEPCAVTPLAVTGGLRWTTLTAGDEHACGVAADGRAYCWGENRAGQLGDGTRTARDFPAPVLGQH
jgi:alpha-tubulin suppressor-like RCC1 family protein